MPRLYLPSSLQGEYSTGLAGVCHTPSRVAPSVGRHQQNTARAAPLTHVRVYAGVRYSALLVGAYARRFGHRFVVEAEGGVAMQSREFRYGKVWYLLRAMRRLLSEADEGGGGGGDRFLMWMDADAVVVHFQVRRA